MNLTARAKKVHLGPSAHPAWSLGAVSPGAVKGAFGAGLLPAVPEVVVSPVLPARGC